MSKIDNNSERQKIYVEDYVVEAHHITVQWYKQDMDECETDKIPIKDFKAYIKDYVEDLENYWLHKTTIDICNDLAQYMNYKQNIINSVNGQNHIS